ncbi:MAG: DUF2752 domain-containing protein [Acidobacteriia bacterium]|nr:DUF2752 domain-containing protein [Terriglobia bacterium]
MTPQFSQGIPRWALLLVAIAAFCAIPPEFFARGPDVCLWRHLFHLAACPACGSTRALAAFFHGRFAEALAFNRNIVVTAPLLLSLLGLDLYHLARRLLRLSNLNSRAGTHKLPDLSDQPS